MGPDVKVALITRRYPPLIGGAERALSYLAPVLAERGVEVTVLTSHLDQDTPEREIVPTRSGHCRIVRLPTSRRRFLGTALHMRGLRKWLGANPVDLAYVSMLKHDAFVAVGAGRKSGFPVVLRPEGAGATGDIAWQRWGRFGRTIARRCLRADAVVAISRAVHDELVQAGFGPNRIIDIPNGVPVPEGPWHERPGWKTSPRAVFVGRLAPEKGLDTLLHAWKRVRESAPTARLVIIGEGPERPALERLRTELGLVDAAELPGAASDPTARLRNADLFVLPSREEGMSIALLEAMALGIPVVASDIPGNRAIVSDLEHGRLAAPDSAESLADAVLDQWGHFERAATMAASARALVRARYSIEAVAIRHVELFERLIAASRSRRASR